MNSLHCFIIADKFSSMKKIFLLITFSVAILFSVAQTLKPASQDNAFADALNKIAADFRNNFVNIQGEKLPAETDADTYKSKVCLPDAVGCSITRYHSVEDNSASWQAATYAGDSYNDAVKMYKKTFGLVKKTKLKGADATGNSFEGELEKDDQNVRFTVSSLRLKTNDKLYKNLVAEVELISNYNGWEVHLNIYTKKADASQENDMQ